MLKYREWEESVSEHLKGDALWNMKTYRLALFAAAVGWQDVTRLASDKRTISLSDQLYRAIGSIGANIAEGYSHSSGKDRARFYEYALGSARESRHCYANVEGTLTTAVVEHRLNLLTEIIRLLLTILPEERSKLIREETITYDVGQEIPNPQ